MWQALIGWNKSPRLWLGELHVTYMYFWSISQYKSQLALIHYIACIVSFFFGPIECCHIINQCNKMLPCHWLMPIMILLFMHVLRFLAILSSKMLLSVLLFDFSLIVKWPKYLLITLWNESYYINSRLKSRSLREQIRCFYYILVIFCINIHFSWVLISFAWI